MVSTEASDNLQKPSLAESVAWLLFCATSLQLILLKYFVKVVSGVRADTFSGVLCSITLAAALLTAKNSRIRATEPEVLISLVLLSLAGLSGLTSTTPWSSTICALVFAANCLGGFWCARILLISRLRQEIFVWLCIGTLAIRLSLSLWGYYFHGVTHYFIEDLHLIVGGTLLLSFSPLTLLSRSNPLMVGTGLAVLISTYAGLYVCGVGGVDSGVVVPMAMLIPAFLIALARPGSKVPLLAVLLVVAAITTHFLCYFSTKNHSSGGYLSERLEFYKFSIHVAEKHPLLGIGLRAPRLEFLSDYEVWHPSLSRKSFGEIVSTLVVSQNIFLTFMVGFGVPFMVLYLFLFSVLYGRLVRAAWRPPPDLIVPPMAILIPLTGSVLHLLTMDILLMPQIAWFFHILLGLIPDATIRDRGETSRLNPRTLILSVIGSAATVALGIFVGTHPALAPQNLPTLDAIKDYAVKVPVVRPFFESKKRPASEASANQGSLVINLQHYQAASPKWSLLFLLDNSLSMAKPIDHWNPSRLDAATAFINSVSQSLPAGCEVAVRAFSDQSSIRQTGKEFPLRVSRLLAGWKQAPIQVLVPPHLKDFAPGMTSLCSALAFSMGRDFLRVHEGLYPRIAILTDGGTECGLDNVIKSPDPGKGDSMVPVVDIVAMGMSESNREVYRAAVRERRGILIALERPDDLDLVAKRYVNDFDMPVLKPLVLRSADKTYTVFPGQVAKLPAGIYTITFQEKKDSTQGEKTQTEVQVNEDMTSIINISQKQGKMVLEKRQEKTAPGE